MADARGRRPRVRAAVPSAVTMTAEERFVLARIDGRLSVDDLSTLTGLEPARVEQIVSHLAGAGAIELTDEDESDKTSLAELAAAVGMDPSLFDDAAAPQAEPAPPPPPAEGARKHPVLRRYTPAAFPAVAAQGEGEGEGEREGPGAGAEEVEGEGEGEGEREREREEADAGEEDDAEADEEAADGDEERAAGAKRNYRQVYATQWQPLLVDQRIAGAKGAHGADLLALCFDADARVIGAVLQNAGVGLDHVRLIAFHHRTGTGLELLARRQEWLRDLLVERRLLRNPMLGASVLARIIAPKTLLQTYKIAIDREVPDLTRTKSRGYVRQKWQSASSEDRADLVLRTEGRCLTIMSGCTFDAKTTGILCGRPINSAMFVQSVAKFGASPPGLLAHLMKQPFVRKNPGLKKMLLAHPNMPGDVKRSV